MYYDLAQRIEPWHYATRQSVRRSFILMSHVYTVQDIDCFSSYDRGMFLVY